MQDQKTQNSNYKESVEIQLNNYELFAKQLLISRGYEFD